MSEAKEVVEALDRAIASHTAVLEHASFAKSADAIAADIATLRAHRDALASSAGVFHAIDQADCALGVAGLSDDDIFRNELRGAKATVGRLLLAAKKVNALVRSPAMSYSQMNCDSVMAELQDAIILTEKENPNG